MGIYAIADLHLSMAPNCEKPMDIFGSRWKNHADRIRENWCKEITDEDTVVIPGDISWALKMEDARYDLEWIDNLPGHKVILKGNHDLWWSGITKMNNMYDGITFLQNDSYSIPKMPYNKSSEARNKEIQKIKNIWICGSRGWITPEDDSFTKTDEKIYKRELLRLKASLDSAKNRQESQDEIICFLHFPPASDYRKFSGFMQIFEDYSVKKVYYGHIHGADNFESAICGNYHGVFYNLISADYLNCKPIRIL